MARKQSVVFEKCALAPISIFHLELDRGDSNVAFPPLGIFGFLIWGQLAQNYFLGGIAKRYPPRAGGGFSKWLILSSSSHWGYKNEESRMYRCILDS